MSAIERFRESAPGAAAAVTQLVVDNPAQFALIGAGTVVITRAAVNLVRPRTALEALALLVVLQVSLPHLALIGIERGWLTFKIRDADGQLVPLRPHGEPGGPGVAAPPAA